jgi:ABC-2 type transport system ATP-binding protein
MKVLEVKNLSKDFGKILAVNDISFDVEEGEIFGLIGPNGAGKTTTLRIIATLLKPSSGQALVCGFDVRHEGEKIRNLISYLPEEAGAYKNLKGIDYLNFMAAFYAADHAQKLAMVARAAEIADLGARLKDKVATYSKGMVRKLLVARALMHAPKLAILDEPTSGLDVINSLEVRKIIKDFARAGTTVLVSSHNMLEVEFLSTRVGLINQGRILEIGEPQKLKAEYGSSNLEEVFIQTMK